MANLLRDHAVLKKRDPAEGGDRVLYLYDVKGYCDKQAARYQGRLWHVLPPFDETHFQACVAGAFPNFGKEDILAVLDGRRVDIGGKLKKNITAAAKGCEHTNKKPLGPQYRFIYSNEEFTEGGFAFSPRAKAICMIPDPLETCFTVLGMAAEMVVRPRKYVDLPGSTFTRGLSSLKLRSREDHEVCLSETKFEELLKFQATGSMEPDGDGQTMPPPPPPEPEAPEAISNQNGARYFYAWSSQEELYLEMLNIFGKDETQDTAKLKVVSFCPGFGQAELACIREDVHCLSLIQSRVHREAR